MKRKLLSDNSNEILRVICKRLRLDYDFYVRSEHQEHPLFPSFRSIAYVISRLGVDTCLIKTDIEEMKQLPKPLLIEYDGLFLLLNDVTDAEVSIINEKNGIDKEPINFLNHLWSGTAMVFDTERQPASYRLSDKIRLLFNRSMYILVGAVIVLSFIFGISRFATQFHILNYIYILTSLGGIFIGMLFQIQEFNRSNSFVNRICHSKRAHGKRDCNSILESGDARFLGLFSWSDFGLLYFLFMIFLSMVLQPIDALMMQALLSVAAAVYIPYSIYYQWRVARKWCALCLLMQGVLFINLCVAIMALCFILSFSQMDWGKTIGISLFVGTTITAVFTTLKSGLKRFIEYRKNSRRFAAIKYDNAVKSLILSSQQKIDTTGLNKIVLNPDGATVLTVIFNTVCNPCVNKMRQVMSMFSRKQNIRLELIFLLDHSDKASIQIAQILLSIYNENPDKFSDKFSEYVTRFPGSANLFDSKDILDNHMKTECMRIIKEQDEWCKRNRITSTPQMFIDGYHFPDIYTIRDIDYIYD